MQIRPGSLGKKNPSEKIERTKNLLLEKLGLEQKILPDSLIFTYRQTFRSRTSKKIIFEVTS
jgi:hypothetical protein